MAFWDFIKKKKPVGVVIRELSKELSDTEGQGVTHNEAALMNIIKVLNEQVKGIDRGIDDITGPDYRTMTITDWLVAMRQANLPYQDRFSNSWVQLFDIFENMVQDSHVQGAIDTLNEGVASKDFFISDQDGNKLDDITDLFKAKWFYEFLGAVTDARMWGFGLIKIFDFDPSNFNIKVSQVNRKHVRPDLNGIVKRQFDHKVWRRWDRAPYKNFTIFLFESNLGKLNRCVRWWIYKIEVARLWAKYNQIYGLPPVIAKTTLKDPTRKANAISMVKNFIKARFMVIDEGDEVEQFNSEGDSNAQQLFENLIRLSDEQISKALLGSTMVLDNGSSRSQGEVHEANTAKFVKSICRTALYTINQDLIPRLRNIGLPIPEGAKFVWDNSEKLTMKERAEVVNILSESFVVPVDTASEFVGIELEEKVVEPSVFDNPGSPIAGAVANYKKILQNES